MIFLKKPFAAGIEMCTKSCAKSLMSLATQSNRQYNLKMLCCCNCYTEFDCNYNHNYHKYFAAAAAVIIQFEFMRDK